VLYIVAQSVSLSTPSSSTIGKSEPSGSRHGNAVSLEIGAFGSVIPSGQAVGSPVSVRHSGSGVTPPLRPASSTSC
jgi:hypothetical protein